MCGFVGVYGPSVPKLIKTLESSSAQLAHRGPDAHGTFTSQSGNCIFAHRRLAILDLGSVASQPMTRDAYTLVYNGEIYNHISLREALPKVRFTSHGDTETLLQLLGVNGLAGLSKCEGMFAGAMYDSRTDRVLLFRDSLGIKPLYLLTLPDSTIVFGSEIKALLPFLIDAPKPDHLSLLNYLQFENFASWQSLFQGISPIRAGTVVSGCMARGKVSLHTESFRFCPSLQFDRTFSYEDSIRNVENTLDRAVQQHFLSDVPVGLSLSGGIDSSLLAAFAVKNGHNPLCFCGTFLESDEYYNEFGLAQNVAKELQLSLRNVGIQPSDLPRYFDQMIWHLDEPRMGMGAFAQFMVARKAAEECRVILSGHGGDELFAGYTQWQSLHFLKKVQSGRIHLIFGQSLRQVPWHLLTIGRVLRGGGPFGPIIFPLSAVLCKSDNQLKSPFLWNKSQPMADALQEYYQNTYIQGLLMVEDRISMAHSLETRTPFWSQELVALVSKIPLNHKLRNGTTKSILRDIAFRLLPSVVAQAPKKGFPTPFRLWFRSGLYEFLRERLLSTSKVELYRIVPRKTIESLVRSHRKIPLPFALDEIRAHKLWILLCLESWARQFHVQLNCSYND